MEGIEMLDRKWVRRDSGNGARADDGIWIIWNRWSESEMKFFFQLFSEILVETNVTSVKNNFG
jgi:hypothetical protein